MKLVTKFNAQVLATNVNYSKDGKAYHNMTVFVPSSGEAGQLNISEILYSKLVPQTEYTFVGEYNDKYNSFRVVGIENE